MHHNIPIDTIQYNFLTKTEEQAKKVLEYIFEVHTFDTLKEELRDWLHALPKEVLAALESLPVLWKTYSTSELLSSWKANFPQEINRYTHVASLFCYLCLFTERCWNLFGKKLHEKQPFSWDFQGNDEYDKFLKEFIVGVDPGTLHYCLMDALKLSTGEEYTEFVRNRIKSLSPGDKQGFRELANHPKVAPKVNLVFLFAFMHSFMDATFFYFRQQRTGS